jgi:hypothetical protein
MISTEETALWAEEEKEAIRQLFKKEDFKDKNFGRFISDPKLSLDQMSWENFLTHFKTRHAFKKHFRDAVSEYGSFVSDISFRWGFGEQEKLPNHVLKTHNKLSEALYPFATVSLGKAKLNASELTTTGTIRRLKDVLILRASINGANVDFLYHPPAEKSYNEHVIEVSELDEKSLEIINVDAKDLLKLKNLFDSIYQFVLHPYVFKTLKILTANIRSVFSEFVFEQLVVSKKDFVNEYRGQTKWKRVVGDEELAAGLALVDNFSFEIKKNYFSFSA